MSDGTSTSYRRITKARFRACSTCLSRSQAPLCLCTLRTISNRAEGTFARLRYILGGDRPSQTTHLSLSSARIHGALLEIQYTKGGISRAPPRQPQPALPRLPPILSEMPQTPISSCSKGSRGLSVLPWVLGIFTETLISPSPSLRQRSSRYAIRAGRNLPDKEFRLRSYSSNYERIITERTNNFLLIVRPCMSPCRRDHIFIQCPGCLAYGL